MGVIGSQYGDTLQNTRSIIARERIKKTVAWLDFPEISRTFASKQVYYNGNGAINAVLLYFRNAEKNDSSRYIADSLLYDANDRWIEAKSFDAAKKLYMHLFITYPELGQIKYLTVLNLNADTIISYQYRNAKGQLVLLEQANRDGVTARSFIFYHEDGLVDNIREENAVVNTLVFLRVYKKKTMLLEAENDNARFRWTYNLFGQCINTSVAAKNRFYALNKASARYRSETSIDYYYNPDGTLSKVTNKEKDRRKITMYYSYFK